MRILFVSSEIFPYAKTGGLADVSGALPIALAQHGAEVVSVMPLYSRVDRKKHKLKKITMDLLFNANQKRSKD